jgi:hypothetical protein
VVAALRSEAGNAVVPSAFLVDSEAAGGDPADDRFESHPSLTRRGPRGALGGVAGGRSLPRIPQVGCGQRDDVRD